MSVLRITLRDLSNDRTRSVLHVAAIAPVVAAYLILIAVAAGLRGADGPPEGQPLVVLSPNPLDPAAGRLDPGVLDLIATVGGDRVSSATPMIFRPIRMDDRIVQLRAARRDTWEPVHGLALLEGVWPAGRDEVAMTEGVALATGWRVGDHRTIFGTAFTVTALVRAPGTKFASIWMPFDRADELFEGRSGFQMVTVIPGDGADPEALRTDLEAAGGGTFAVYFEATLAAEATARRGAADGLAAVSTAVGVAALGFGVFNLAALTLVERRRDLGITRTLGVAPVAVAATALLRSLVLSGVGFAGGAALAGAVLATAAPTTVRSFVFTPGLPAVAWGIGAALTAAATVVGTALALRGPARSPITTLLEPR